MGFFDSEPEKTTTTSTTTATLPPWLQAQYQSLVDKASTAAGESALNPDELAAFNMIRNMGTQYQDTIGSSISGTQSILDKMAGGFGGADAEARMNPYLQSVLDRQRAESERSFYSGLEGLRDQEASAGAFGGSRGAVAEENLRRNYSDTLSDLQSEGIYNAFENARGQYNLENQMGLQGQTALAGLAGAGQNAALTQAQALQSAGAAQRLQPLESLSWLNSVISPAAQTLRGETTENVSTKEGGGGSMFSKVGGLAMAAAGAFTGNPMLIAGGLGMAGGGGGMFGGGGGSAGQSSPARTPTASSSYNRTLERGFSNPNLYGPGFAEGGLIEDMPDYIRNAPDLSWEEKLREWGRESSAKGRAETYRQHSEESDVLDQYMSNDDPTASSLLDKVLSDVVRPSRKPSVSVLDKVSFRGGDVSPSQTDWIMQRNPGLAEVVSALEGASAEEINSLFTMDRKDLGYACGGKVQKYDRGGTVRGNMLSIGPLLMSEEDRARYEAGEIEPWMQVQTPTWNDIYQGAAGLNDVLNRVDTGLDDLRKPLPKTGSRLERAIKSAAEAPRTAASLLGEVAISPLKVGKAAPEVGAALGEWLAANPDVEASEDQMALMRERGNMTSEDRRSQDILDAFGDNPALLEKVISEVPTPRSAEIPTESMGMIQDSMGRGIPMERLATRSMARQETPKEEEAAGGMNIPLIMAGLAMINSKGDPFESLGAALGAYVGGKQQIAEGKEAARERKLKENLAERTMQVEEGKLENMRNQLALDAKKLSKESGISADKIQDDLTNLIKVRIDGQAAALLPGQPFDVNAAMDEAIDWGRSVLSQTYGGKPVESSRPVNLTKRDELMQRVSEFKNRGQ